MSFARMRLLRLAHSILDHPVLVLCLSGLCLRAPGRGEPGFRGGPCPGCVVFLLLFVILDLKYLALSHRFTCKMGFRSHGPLGSFGEKKKRSQVPSGKSEW